MENINLIHLLESHEQGKPFFDIIYNILNKDNLSQNQRNFLFSIIEDKNLFNHSIDLHSLHSFEGKNFNFISQELNSFFQKNSSISTCEQFIINNLMNLYKEEIKKFYQNYLLQFERYDETITTIIYKSPLFLQQITQKNTQFNEFIHTNILQNLIDIEKKEIKTNNPIINEAVKVIDTALINPEYFQHFIPMWKQYGKFFLSDSTPENDLFIIMEKAPNKLELYQNYLKSNTFFHPHEKKILSYKLTEFFFTHYNFFVSFSNQIPNATTWIVESADFLQTNYFMNNLEKKHLDYFSQYHKSSKFHTFLNFLFEDNIKLNHSQKIKKLISSHIDFEEIFSKNKEKYNFYDKKNSNFEAFLIKKEHELKEKDLLLYYLNNKIVQKIDTKENIKKLNKI